MASADPLNRTLEYLHQLRGSTLPIDAVTFNHHRGHILTCDEGALRLWSLRKQLDVVIRPEDSPPALALAWMENADLYLLAEGRPKKSSDEDDDEDKGDVQANIVRLLSAKLENLAEFRPHPPGIDFVAAAVHQGAGAFLSAASDGEVRVWSVRRSIITPSDGGSVASAGGASSALATSLTRYARPEVQHICSISLELQEEMAVTHDLANTPGHDPRDSTILHICEEVGLVIGVR